MAVDKMSNEIIDTLSGYASLDLREELGDHSPIC